MWGVWLVADILPAEALAEWVSCVCWCVGGHLTAARDMDDGAATNTETVTSSLCSAPAKCWRSWYLSLLSCNISNARDVFEGAEIMCVFFKNLKSPFSYLVSYLYLSICKVWPKTGATSTGRGKKSKGKSKNNHTKMSSYCWGSKLRWHVGLACLISCKEINAATRQMYRDRNLKTLKTLTIGCMKPWQEPK